MSSSITTDAIVLSRINYAEADRILQILTPSYGKIGAIARAVRREKSKLASGIELLAVCKLTLHQGRGELAIVTSARLETFFSNILSDYDRLQFAYYVLKDISKSAEQMAEPAFYYLALTSLRSLDDQQIDLAVIDVWYRLQMAILLGVGINLETDQNGMKLVEGARYRFDTDEMSFVYDDKGSFTSDHIKLLRVMSAQNPAVITHVKNYQDLIGECCSIGRIAHE